MVTPDPSVSRAGAFRAALLPLYFCEGQRQRPGLREGSLQAVYGEDWRGESWRGSCKNSSRSSPPVQHGTRRTEPLAVESRTMKAVPGSCSSVSCVFLKALPFLWSEDLWHLIPPVGSWEGEGRGDGRKGLAQHHWGLQKGLIGRNWPLITEMPNRI